MNEPVVQSECKQPSFSRLDVESYNNNKQALTDMADMMNGYPRAEALGNS